MWKMPEYIGFRHILYMPSVFRPSFDGCKCIIIDHKNTTIPEPINIVPNINKMNFEVSDK